MTGGFSQYGPYADCVNAGSQLFDLYYPGWVYEVSNRQLDMRQRRHKSAMAQVATAYGSWYEVELLRMLIDGHGSHLCDVEVRYGFVPCGGVSEDLATEIWRHAIRERREVKHFFYA